MRLEFSSFIEEDLESIADYIAENGPNRAVAFLSEIGRRFQEIAEWPLLYQLRPEIGENARVALLGRYAILFRIVRNHEETVRLSVSSMVGGI